MFARNLITLGLSVGVALYFLHAATAPSNGGSGQEVSQLYGEDGELWDPTSRLPDFSHAGYHSGEAVIPDLPVVTNLMDFGAVGDGVADDSDALKNAIAATSNGALFVPPGRYRLEKPVLVNNKRNFVLRGAGEGQTVFFIPQSAEDAGSSKYIYFMGAAGWSTSNTELGNVVVSASRGDTSITLDASPAVGEGDLVNLVSGNHPDLATQLAGGQGYGSEVLDKAVLVDTVLRVSSVEGNTIHFLNPLRTDIRPEWNFKVKTYGVSVEEVGFEDFTIEMLGAAKLPHLQEPGFNGISLSRALHSWIRRVTVIDCDNGMALSGTRFCEIRDVTIKADKRNSGSPNNHLVANSHHGISCGSYAQDNLITNFRDSGDSFDHGECFSAWECVFEWLY